MNGFILRAVEMVVCDNCGIIIRIGRQYYAIDDECYCRQCIDPVTELAEAAA